MDELRLVRREDQSLVVSNDAGDEFRLVVDDAILSELRHLSRRERDTSKVRPREIQAMIRAGKSHAQVVEATGLDEADIERYAEPVLAERRYILERAHAVAVRTDVDTEEDQRFGSVIAERLIALGTDTSEWSSWKDEESGWLISLEFISHDVAHQAIWTFEHRKGALSPINSDAVNLSKQGDVGDRLIPKLRAVDANEAADRFDSGAFDAADLPGSGADGGPEDVSSAADPATGGAFEPTSAADAGEADLDVNAEYERRREIDQRAISTSDQLPEDLSQTADLLDALRKRRGERDRSRQSAGESTEEPAGASAPQPGTPADPVPGAAASEQAEQDRPAPQPRSIWQGAGVSRENPDTDGETEAATDADRAGSRPQLTPVDAPQGARPETADAPGAGPRAAEPAGREKPAKKGRASIPSWDDILFGTRSDEDPA